MLIDTRTSLTERIGIASVKEKGSRPERRDPQQTTRSRSLLFRRRLLRSVEPLDHFAGQIESGVDSDNARVADAENHHQALIDTNLLDDRVELLLEIALQLIGHVRDFGLRVLLCKLKIALRFLNVL